MEEALQLALHNLLKDKPSEEGKKERGLIGKWGDLFQALSQKIQKNAETERELTMKML